MFAKGPSGTFTVYGPARQQRHQLNPNRSFISGVLAQDSPGRTLTSFTNTRRNASMVASSVNASALAAGSKGSMSSKIVVWPILQTSSPALVQA